MGNNKHPHHDLIVEWAKDTSKIVELLDCDDEWEECDIYGPAWCVNTKYRFKPREFVKGHWYPCVEKGEEASKGYPRIFNGVNFADWEDDTCLLGESEFEWIGESLGEINFGGGE